MVRARHAALAGRKADTRVWKGASAGSACAAALGWGTHGQRIEFTARAACAAGAVEALRARSNCRADATVRAAGLGAPWARYRRRRKTCQCPPAMNCPRGPLRMTACCVMVLGTTSGAGKSSPPRCAAGMRQGAEGRAVKAQNMSNNARVVGWRDRLCPVLPGAGRAGRTPHVRMNAAAQTREPTRAARSC